MTAGGRKLKATRRGIGLVCWPMPRLGLEGFDLAPVTGAKATGRRIHSLGGAIDRAFCRVAALEDSGLPDSSAHGIVCVDALGRAADQDAAVRELGRVRVPRFSGSPTALSVPADRMEGMTIKDVTRHDIAEERIEDTLQRGIRQAIGHWSDMRHGSRPLRQGLREMCGDLLDLRRRSHPGRSRPGYADVA